MSSGAGSWSRIAAHLVAKLVSPESLQLDPDGLTGALELEQEWARRMPALDLVVAVGQDQREPLSANPADQEGQEVPGRAV